jgi:transcriptional regulator with XRE-family HTH domain
MGLRQVFATNLRYWRLQRGLSQEALAHCAGIDRTYVSSLERQRYSPTLDMVETLAASLELEADVLLTALAPQS